MASSGTITLNLQSIDNYNIAGPVCWPDSRLTRGGATYTPTFNWSVSDAGVLTVSFAGGGSTGWYVCSDSDAYYLKVQFSTDLVNWTDIMTSQRWQTICDQNYKVSDLISDLSATLGSATLTQSGYIRIYSYTGSACPNPSINLPEAYPTEAASQAVAADVHIDVNWTAQLKYSGSGTGLPTTQSHTQTGNSYTFVVSNTIPTRTNYRFDGWATTNGGAATYHGGDSYTVYKSDPVKTLYAVWTEYYRPGATLYSADEYHVSSPVWYSNNKTNGACHIRTENAWQEMRTIDGTSDGQGNPPLIYRNDSLYNQKKLGKS